MKNRIRNFDPRFVLVTVPVIWGINFTIMKIGLQTLEPIPYNTSRLIVATIISWILVYTLKVYKKIKLRDLQAIIIVSLVGFALPQIGITIGVSLTTAGNCALIMALVPISVIIINRFINKTFINKTITRGIFISFTGVTLVILGTNSGLSISTSDLAGILVMLVAQFCSAYFTIYSGPLVEKYSPYLLIAITMTTSSLVFILLSFNSLVSVNWVSLPSSAWFSMFYSGILALAIGNFLWVWGVREIGSTRTAIYSNLTPVFAIVTGCLVLNEAFGLFQSLGALIILTGLIMTQRGQRPSKYAPKCFSPNEIVNAEQNKVI